MKFFKISFAVAFCFALVMACGKGGSKSNSPNTTSTPAVQVANDRALLSWSAASGMPDGYYVFQSTDNATWSKIQTVTETSTYVDGLSTGTKYYFEISSYNSLGTSTTTSTSISVTL